MSFDDYRELCPDGACVGVIGNDGRCKECGRVSPNSVRGPRIRGLELASSDAEEVDFDGDRVLCPDGACVGVIGETGVCSECGRRPETGVETQTSTQTSTETSTEIETGAKGPGMRPQGSADWEARRLCPDGGCIGVLDESGDCPACGTETS